MKSSDIRERMSEHSGAVRNTYEEGRFDCEHALFMVYIENSVTVQQTSFCEGFACKIPSYASKNPITKGDLEWIFARNCEGTEQLQDSLS